MKIYRSLEELVGRTPLLELVKTEKRLNLDARLLVKLEMFNPAGSAKDRVALSMLNDAEKRGVIGEGSVIIEPTSGNTGIALAAIGVARGYRVIIVMPDSMSRERRLLMSAYGAELVLTDGALGMQGAIDRAEELQKSIPGAIVTGQFVNPANPAAHLAGTGPEIWEDTDGEIDIFVAGVGTGGTISGVGRYLKGKNAAVRTVAVEPETSPLLSGGYAGRHGIQGIGANFVPEILDREVIDGVCTVSDENACTAARELGKFEGLLVGISSGAAMHAAIELAKRPENFGKTIVALLADSGERYLSTPMFSES